jgi:hypothetical protein
MRLRLGLTHNLSDRLQLAALMYERGAEPVKSAIVAAHEHGISPSSTISGAKEFSVTHTNAFAAVDDNLHKNVISDHLSVANHF